MIRADIWLPDPASVLATGAFGAGALIRLERSDDDGDTYTEITTLPVVATSVQYQYWDADGDETSLYRWRVSDTGNTIDSPYSAPFAGTNPATSVLPASYATLAQALTAFENPPTGSRLARLGNLLGTATDQIVDLFRGRDYFRHPTTGTETWTLDVLRHPVYRWQQTPLGFPLGPQGPVMAFGANVLHCHDGLVTVTLVEVSRDLGATYTALGSSEWVLRGNNPWSNERREADEPAFHVVLTGSGLKAFPCGVNAVRLTGARGWAVIPPALVEATAQRARQLAYSEVGFDDRPQGGDEMGPLPANDRYWPPTLWNFVGTERQRFRACV